ncbi:MAG: tRNA (N(6)-L-threonylcarbamoyladenosine(37)-C(2))-methylthiotransferase MtaB [Rhodospirillales bacterium]|nr:tRNA (N(6)-L-threonylcarbamoyladenosine(37)-C(2))-methylthiotransferase MtaB [Rhodospirillales bacterium]
MSNPTIVTFGCRLNAFESEAMRTLGGGAAGEGTVIVNTCAVTAEAERQARQAIRRLRRDNPKARIIVTGCAAQIDPQRFAAMPEVDRVIGNAAKLDPDRLDGPERLVVDEVERLRDLAPHFLPGFEGRSRAFLQVQGGCDHRCSFCIVPKARGPAHSVATERVVAQAEALVANGYRELVLTGVDLSSWSDGGAPNLAGLVALLLDRVSDLPRLRLSSLDPAAIDDALIDLMGRQPRLMPHLHLSVQSGADAVLKKMARRHRAADLDRAIGALRAVRPEITLGADLIAGFPGETEADQAATLALVERLGLTHLHVFPFSPRPGTPAAAWKRPAAPIAKARAAQLRALGESLLADLMNRRLGGTARVLVEEAGWGKSEDDLPVHVAQAPAGRIVAARLEAIAEGGLSGRVLA